MIKLEITYRILNMEEKLVKQIRKEWVNSQDHIKRLIVKYLLGDLPSKETFMILYNEFQRLIVDEADILYYLNPLKFPGYEHYAMSIIKINNKLNYNGFISSCQLEGISVTDFVNRF